MLKSHLPSWFPSSTVLVAFILALAGMAAARGATAALIESSKEGPFSSTPSVLGACQNQQTALWGLCRMDGSAAPPVVAQRYAFIGAASQGTAITLFPARLSAADPMGYITIKGEWAIDPQYANAMPFTEGLAVVSDGTRSGAIDGSGRIVVAWFDGLIYPYSQGLACVVPGGFIRLGLLGRMRQKFFGSPGDSLYSAAWWQIQGMAGFVDTAGRQVIAPRFQPKLSFLLGGCGFSASGYAAMRQNELEGLIDRTGNWVIQPTFEYLGLVFSGNSKVVALIAERRQRSGFFLDNIERLDGSLVSGEQVRWRESGDSEEAMIGGGLVRALVNQLLFPQWQRDLLNDNVSSRTLAAWSGSILLCVAAAIGVFRRPGKINLATRLTLSLISGALTLAVTFIAGAITLFSTAALLLMSMAWLVCRLRRRKFQT